jgi:Lsr2
VAFDIVADGVERQAMAKVTVEVLVDDLDGSEGAETVRLGWNGDWREIDLSKKNRPRCPGLWTGTGTRPVRFPGLGDRAVDRAGPRRLVQPALAETPR